MPAIIQPPDERGYVAKEEPKLQPLRISYMPKSEYDALTRGQVGIIYTDAESVGQPQKWWDEKAKVFVVSGTGTQLTQQDIIQLIEAQSAAVETEIAQLIQVAKEEAKNLQNATGVLSTLKVESGNGESVEARFIRLEAALAPASSTDPSIVLRPVLSGTVGVGNDLTLTGSAVSAGSGGASSLNFGSGNTTRRLTTTSVEPLTDSTGWSVGVWWRLSGTPANEVMLGFGTGGAASSFQIRTFSSTEIGAQVRDASGSNVDARIAYPAAGDYLVVAQYSDADGALRVYIIPKGGTVSGPSDSTVVALATVTPAAGWYIGSDGTNWTTRPIGEAFKVNRLLTNGELTSLAAGNPITSVLTPRLYWPLRNGPQATEANQGAATGADATLVGSSYATAPVFFGANPYKHRLVLRKTAADGVVSVLIDVTQAANTIVYKQSALDDGATITGAHTPVDSITNRPGNTLSSNTIGPIIADKPSGGTVTVTPGGSQPGGTAFTANFGTGWSTPSGANTFRGRWELDSVALTDYSAASPAYTTNGQQTGVLEFVVIAKSGVGADSAPVRSNAVTLTGTPTVSVVTPSVFVGGHLFLETKADISPTTWNVSGYTVLGYDIRRNGVVIRSRTLQTVPEFTPHAPPHTDGAAVDDVFDVSEYILYNGLTYWSAPQALTLEDTPTTLAASTVIANQSVTSGVSTSFTPTASTGGISPRRATGISPALPGTFALAEDGSISGAFGGTQGAIEYTVTWTDNVGDTDTATFNFSVAAAGVTALPALSPQTTATVGGGTIARNQPDPIASSPAFWVLRTITNPAYPGLREMRAEDFFNYSSGPRLLPATDNWLSGALSIKVGSDIPRVGGADDSMLIFQTHTEESGDTSPDISLHLIGQSNTMKWRRAYNENPPSQWNYNGGPVPDTTSYPILHSEAMIAAGVRYRFIIHYRPGFLASHFPRFRVWRSINGGAYTLLFDDTGLNTYNVSAAKASYARIGPYKWNSSAWKAASHAFYTSPLYFGVGADLYAEAAAAIAGL